MALTESCKDLTGLLGILQRGDETALSDHLKLCAACRKLVADTVRGLVLEGDVEGPPAVLRTMAGKILGRDSGEDPVVTVVASGDRIIEVGNAEGEAIGRSGVYRLEVAHDLGPFAGTIETVAGIFVFRLKKAPGGEKGTPPSVTLRTLSGEAVAPSRKLAEPASWTGLPPGRYVLVAAGPGGRAAVVLHLVHRGDGD